MVRNFVVQGGCQFYVVANRQDLPKLDNHYADCGKVIKGMEVVEATVSPCPRTPRISRSCPSRCAST
jgi:cyclophilin family peptidyl-prolyl cis-trans isomerase